MFFLSSPPQPPPQFQSQFYSSANPFAFQPAYAPSTPSPLRTSYNANGIRRSRMSDHESLGHATKPLSFSSPISRPSADHDSIEDRENSYPDRALTSNEKAKDSDQISFSSPIFPTSTASVATQNAAPSRYESRSRGSTPTALLQSHAKVRKAESRQRFLDRIRTRRDEGFGRDDRILRADYLEERKAWEREMRQLALIDGGEMGEVDEEWQEVVDEDAEDRMVMSGDVKANEAELGGDDSGMSPTEEKEIEALIELWDGDDARLAEGDGDSQEWDEVFMEVLSQEQPQVQIQPGFAQGEVMLETSNQERLRNYDDQQGMDMDMS